MPFIDVTDLLTDTYIAGEQFTVYRRTEIVNKFGENLIGVMVYNNVFGQISPTPKNSLIRHSAFTAQDKSIRVITTWPLTGATMDGSNNLYQPDLVYWKNNLYIVRDLEDYTKYGVGFVVADCEVYDWIVNITNIPLGVTHFVVTTDGQFVISSDSQISSTAT
jgi:galactose-6-phosphate isomerase